MDKLITTPMDPATIRILVRFLDRLDGMSERFAAIRAGGAPRTSIAASDKKRPLGHLTWVFAHSSWASAEDHLRAWRIMLSAGLQPERAHYSLVRSALDGALICRWLLDARSPHDERLARGVRAQLDDWVRRGQLETALGYPTPEPGSEARTAAQREAELRAEMFTAGISAERPWLPAMTDLYQAFSVGGWFYNLLSAYAHGRNWSVMTARLGRAVGVPGLSGARMVQVQANDTLTLAAASESIKVMNAALGDLEAYVRPRPGGRSATP